MPYYGEGKYNKELKIRSFAHNRAFDVTSSPGASLDWAAEG